jgi:hypothetical protein
MRPTTAFRRRQSNGGGCFRSVDSSSEGDGKFVALAAEAHYQMVPRGRFGQTKRATPQTREPRAHIAGLAVALLGLGLAQHGLRGSNMTRVRAPVPRERRGGGAKAPRALAMGATPHSAVAQRPPPLRSRGADRWPAITSAAPLAGPPHSTSPRVRRSARGAAPAPWRDSSPPPPALVAGAATLPASPGGAPGPFVEFCLILQQRRPDQQI